MKFGYYEGKNTNNNVTSLLKLQAQKNPKKVIFYWLDSKQNVNLLSFENFFRQTSSLASAFHKLGIGFGDRVIIFLPMTVHLYYALSALQWIGAIPVVLDSWTRNIHLKTCAEQVKPKAIISFEKAFGLIKSLPELDKITLKISAGPTTNSVKLQLENFLNSSDTIPFYPVKQEDTALITFTTGSSGIPKGADRSHRFLAAQHYAISKCIPYKKNDIDLPVFPIFSLNNVASGISTILPAFDVGAPKDTDAKLLYLQLSAFKATCTTLSPSFLVKLSEYCLENHYQLPYIRRLVTGGAPINRTMIKNATQIAPNATIKVLYGSTEVEPITQIDDKTMLSINSREDIDDEWVDEGVLVGKIVKGLRYKIITINKNPIMINNRNDFKKIKVTRNQVGELIVTGEHVCKKYYKNPQAFKRAKIVDLNGTIWHRTGDLVRVDHANNFWIVGRVHNTIKRNGEYFFPVRAETLLKRLPFVLSAAYLGLTDSFLGEKAIAVVVLKEENKKIKATTKYESKIRYVFKKNTLAIDEIIFLDTIPMDPRHHSKVEYNKLKEILS
jgi:acyl-coenzyme A synthetase/AMP-(fatty) acid ligase